MAGEIPFWRLNNFKMHMKKIGSFTHKKYVLQRGKVMAKLALLRFILTASVMYFQWVCVHFSTPISIQNLWGLVTDMNLSNFYWGELRRPIKLHAKLAKRKKVLVIKRSIFVDSS